MAPPPALRERVLAAVGRGQTPASAAAARPFSSYSGLAAAASLVLAVALGAYAAQLRNRIGALEVELQEATARADANERQLLKHHVPFAPNGASTSATARMAASLPMVILSPLAMP